MLPLTQLPVGEQRDFISERPLDGELEDGDQNRGRAVAKVLVIRDL